MKNVVFVALPKIETVFPSGAIAILSSVAKVNNYDSVVYDYNLDLQTSLTATEWNELELWNTFAASDISTELEDKIHQIFIKNLEKYTNSQTEYVCFCVFSYFSNQIALKVLNWYNQISNIPSVVGGAGISTDASATNKEIFGNLLVRNQLATYVVFGEGELAFDSILKKQFDFPGINVNNPQQIEDLSVLPIPTYEYFDMERYQNQKILITGSRGCVRNCTFCDIELTWPKFRYRKAEHIVEEIKQHFYEYGITEFEFTDSLINGSMSNFDRFNELLYEAKQKDPALEKIKYQGQFICRPSGPSQDKSYELMHLAGCNMLITGIESFSQNVRNHMRKKFNNSDIDYHFEQCARWGIPNILLMIVGYPTETEQDHLDNINAIKRYKPYVDMGTIFMVRWGLTMHLYEHTPIMSMLKELDINISNDIKFDSVYSWTSGNNPTNTLQERIRRRLEIHELCVELGYPMPRVLEELLVLVNLAEKSRELKKKTIFKLELEKSSSLATNFTTKAYT
jgi:radical SAM superfamily enzyme YgiQ (UPF0313 family)